MGEPRQSSGGGVLDSVVGSAATSGLFGAGLIAVFAGERIFAGGRGRQVVSLLGVALLGAALALRGLRVLRKRGDARWIERRALDAMSLAALSVLLYFAGSDAAAFAFGGKSLAVASPKVATALNVLWPALWIAGVLPLLLVELSYASMARAPHLETGRVREAFLSGLGLGFTLVFAFAVVYVAAERDRRVDLSYFRTTRPSEAVRKLVRTFTEPVTVTYFFPAGSDVREEVRSYFADLAGESPNFQVHSFDQAVDPAKAKELGVTTNGAIVFAKGGRREQMTLGLELEQAKSALRNLDKDAQKRLLQVARPGRTVYLTTGHGERRADPEGDTDKRGTVRDLRTGLQELSYTVRDLGLAEGLGSEVPIDAGIVMVVGPQKALLSEEVAALLRYVDRGGRLYLALDAESGLEAKELLGPLGVVFHPQTLANETQYARRLNQPVDRTNIVTSSYSSNPSVQTLGRVRAPVIFVGAGWLEEVPFKDRPKGNSVDMAVHALAQTWADLDGNFQFDAAKEARRSYELAAAITRKPAGKTGPSEEGRVFVIADSDLLTDTALLAVGNRYLLLDPIRWLAGDEAIAGETSSEVDVPIAHTRSQDVLWFYGAIFFAPAVALGIGWLATRKTRRKRARPAAPPASGAGSSGSPVKEAA